VDRKRRLEDRADLVARVQRAVGILEHELHRTAQELAFLRWRLHGVDSAELQRARARLLDQRDQACERGFAAARFADHGERPSGLDAERHAADRLQLQRGTQQAAPDRVAAAQLMGLDDHPAAHGASARCVWPRGK
jgi:hypothetical protein